MRKAKTPDNFFAEAPLWRDELLALRKALTSCGLIEEIKWGAPCYTLNGVNVVGLGAFKSYVGLWFHQGALLKDEARVLVNAQDGRTKAQRQWRMTSPAEIKPKLIQAYVKEAAALAAAGEKIAPDRNKELVVPPALTKALKADKAAGAAFKVMSKGRQREFADYIAEAKQETTKQKRLDKILPLIRVGGGLHDKYR